jgi:hypothetical protein
VWWAREGGLVFFARNGKPLPAAFRRLAERAPGPLYPVVALHAPGQTVRLNAGQRPYRLDVAGLLEEERARLRADLARVLEPPEPAARRLETLLAAHLRLHGYGATLAALPPAFTAPADASGTPPPGARSLEARRLVRQAICEGRVDDAWRAIETAAPGLLERRPALARMFECQRVIELVRAGPERLGDALAAAQAGAQLARALSDGTAEERAEVCEALGLLAYTNPWRSPLAHLLTPERRQFVAEAANAALLEALEPPGAGDPRSQLERLLAQLLACQDALRQENASRGPPFTLDSL